jgi:DNA-binding CsgD family transcriptional regulator
MALTLSTADLAQLSTALQTLTSPLAYDRLGDWRAAIRCAIEPLLGVQLSGTVLSLPGEPLAEGTPGAIAPARDCHGYFDRLQTGATRACRQWGIEIFRVYDICDWAEPSPTDRARRGRPPRLYDAIAMVVELGSALLPAAAHFFRERDDAQSFGERASAILQLLMPAFTAGVQTALRLGQHRAALMRMVDRLRQAMLVFDAEGQLLHANPALRQLVADESGKAAVLAAARRLAQRLGHLARCAPREVGCLADGLPAVEELRAGSSRLRLWGSYLVEGAFTSDRCIVEAVEQITSESLGSVELRGRYHLTERECEVARALALGHSNREIAAALGIRERTAEHHTEHVLLKLEVHSRAAVGAVLRGLTCPGDGQQPTVVARVTPRSGSHRIPCRDSSHRAESRGAPTFRW